jgi:hypothetical protein
MTGRDPSSIGVADSALEHNAVIEEQAQLGQDNPTRSSATGATASATPAPRG